MAESAETTAETEKKPLVVRVWLRFFGACLCAVVILGAIQFYRHRNDPKLINYCVACIPVVLTILIAFVPDLRRAHMGWRLAIVGLGFIWSFLLWRQIVINSAADIAAQTNIVNDAVGKANNHSDDQFRSANQHADAKFGEVEKDVEGVSNDFNSGLKAATGDITAGLGKVGKPDPPSPPRLAFTLTDTPPTTDAPVRSETIKPNADGTYSFKFNVSNVADVSGDQLEMWLTLCKVCEFVGEPKGSDHPPGELPRMRHFVLGSMNAGVGHGEVSVTFKVTVPEVARGPFGVTFAYACKICGKPHNEPDYILNVDDSSTSSTPQ
jgi:hypothetical protein